MAVPNVRGSARLENGNESTVQPNKRKRSTVTNRTHVCIPKRW